MNKFGILIFLFIFAGCGISSDNVSKLVTESEFIFGTRVAVSIFPVKDRDIKKDIRNIFIFWEKMHQSLSVGVSESFIARLNRESRLESSDVKDDSFVFKILRSAFYISRKTSGAFDPTLLRLSKLWGFSGEKAAAKPPEHDLIIKTKRKTGRRNFYFKKESVFLKNDVQIDLGGIAKGSAADYAVSKLKNWGYHSAIINIGGDVYLYGTRPGKKKLPWRVGIAHPRFKNRQYCILSVSNEAVVTSGNYERYFIYQNKRYHHLLDPATGYPADKCISVTVTGPSCEKADAYATALFVMGPEQGIEFINKVDGYSAMILFLNRKKKKEDETNSFIKAVYSKGFKKKYRIQF
ncbi:MAG: FAD:protein FMN transferase [Spirochaetes bacterium]|nr:FAD:protein FMN transferase [Spirochaetota bacterium]